MKKLLVITFVLLPFVAFSQIVLTSEDCIRLAKENNKAIEASEYQLQAAIYEHKSSTALFFPSITLGGNLAYSSVNKDISTSEMQIPVFGQSFSIPPVDFTIDVGMIYNANIKLEQPIFMGGKILAAERMTKAAENLAEQNKRLQETDVVIETFRAYAGVVKASELQKVALSYNSLLSELHRSVAQAKSHGLKTQNDLLKVEVKLRESELNLTKANNAVRLSKMNLCHYIGYAPDTQIEIDNRLPETEILSFDYDISQRADYLMLEYKSEVFRQDLAMAKSEHLPQIGMIAQYGYLNAAEINDTKLFDDWNYMVGINVSIPLFDFGHRLNKIKSANAKYMQVKTEQQYNNELFLLDITRATDAYKESLLEERMAQTAMEAAQENLRISTIQYEKGAETLSDHLEAQTLWLQAQQAYIEAKTQTFIKRLEYLKATGQMN